MRVLWWALISVIGLYLTACITFGTGPLFLAYNTVSDVGGLFLVAAILVGGFWAWLFIGRGFLRTATIILAAYILLGSALSPVIASSVGFYPSIANQVTTALTGSQDVLTQPSILIFAYPSSCVLTAGNDSTSEASGYNVFSYSHAQSASMANCNGFGFLQVETYASGISASASAESSVWWRTSNIYVPKITSGYSFLSVQLDLSINGWQVPSGGPSTTAETTLQYAMKLIRDDGYQEYLFSRQFQNGVSFGGDYGPAYNRMLVESGHSYSVIVVFNATSYSKSEGLTTATTTETCFGFPSGCGSAKGQMGNSGYCPAGVPSIGGNCPFIEWRFASYNITRD